MDEVWLELVMNWLWRLEGLEPMWREIFTKITWCCQSFLAKAEELGDRIAIMAVWCLRIRVFRAWWMGVMDLINKMYLGCLVWLEKSEFYFSAVSVRPKEIRQHDTWYLMKPERQHRAFSSQKRFSPMCVPTAAFLATNKLLIQIALVATNKWVSWKA